MGARPLHASGDVRLRCRAMRKFFEQIVALSALVLLAPLVGMLILLIRRDSPGPGLFRQDRVGKDRKVFCCYKLRTMATGTRQAGTHEVGAASVTRMGGFLRKSKLDELPQLWNVAKGDMAFVGPRPCLPTQGALIHERDLRGVYGILPGITGLAQIRGIDMSEPVRLAECDAEYLRARSMGCDLRILLQTLVGKGSGDRVNSR